MVIGIGWASISGGFNGVLIGTGFVNSFRHTRLHKAINAMITIRMMAIFPIPMAKDEMSEIRISFGLLNRWCILSVTPFCIRFTENFVAWRTDLVPRSSILGSTNRWLTLNMDFPVGSNKLGHKLPSRSWLPLRLRRTPIRSNWFLNSKRGISTVIVNLVECERTKVIGNVYNSFTEFTAMFCRRRFASESIFS